MLKKVLFCLLTPCLLSMTLKAQSRENWVDSVFNNMTIDDKIGQLFMISISPQAETSDLNEVVNKIKNNTLGGIVFSELKNLKQAQLITQFQSISKIPLLIGLDGQSRLGTNLDSALRFPSPQALGALADDSLLFFMGNEVAREMKLMGIHLNFIPANLSVNENTRPVMSFGEDRFLVAAKSLAYWKGLQSGGLLACAKYFPIQGLSITEIQKGLPAVTLTVDSVQAYPFKVLFKNRLPALMPASSDLPLFYTKKKTARKNVFSSSSLSAAFAGDWIRHHMNYEGLFMVDIQNMTKTADKKFSAGEAEMFAFQAGNDMLITSGNIGAAIRKMKKMLRKEKTFIPHIDRSVRKILAMKYDAGLYRKQDPVENLLPELITIEARLLQRRLYQNIPTIVSNQQNTLPVQSLENKKFICVVADDSLNGKAFTAMTSKYVHTTVMNVNPKSDTLFLNDSLYTHQVILVAVFPETQESTLLKLLPVLKEQRINREVIICDFGSTAFRPYSQEFPTVITGYTEDPVMLEILPQVLFGGLSANGTLPVSFGQIAPGTTTKTTALGRLTYSFPEDAGMDSETLNKIEAIAQEAIDMRATPGCHVLVAREGKVIYERSFGHLTYEKQSPVTDETIYDLASVTKVSATLQTTMFMYERGLIDINKKASVYLPELKGSNKKDFVLKDILTHQSGLRPFIPFYAMTMKDTLHLPEFYSSTLSRQYPLVVADNLFASAAMKDSLWGWVIKGKLQEKPPRTPFDYTYSDMGFYMLQHLAERILNQPQEDFLNQNLYEPLGAYTTGYLPLVRFSIHQIAPTENDKIFRKALLIGTVHDPGAAMQGGVAGHAGLFSNANDLAKLYQMLLQEGRYGGVQYYKPETVRLFTQKQFHSSRRGLGWDKPTGDWKGSTGIYASPKTFGHTGYTGTCVWVDPEFNLVYIFLSNRVHPVVTNKLLSANIRSRIQDVIYQSIFDYCKTAGNKQKIPVNSSSETFGTSQ